MKVKEESEKVGLKLNIQKTKIMASSHITLWQIDGETVRDFILGGSKIIADGDCTQRKRCRDPRCSPRGNPACRGTFGGRRKAVRDRLALQGGTGDFP